jgi:hypothetical protein
MGGEVQLSRIMEDQQGIGLIHPLTRESEMGGRDPVVGHFGAVTAAIDGTEWIPGGFGRERPFGLVGDLMCGDTTSRLVRRLCPSWAEPKFSAAQDWASWKC